jgi:hypothetical protein
VATSLATPTISDAGTVRLVEQVCGLNKDDATSRATAEILSRLPKLARNRPKAMSAV